MEIQHLKYFLEVVRQESFTRAAAQLYVTQPMLTRAIKQLEESLNVLLIERTSKSFRLTDAGRILYDQAQEFLLRYDEIFQTMADVRSVKTGSVQLSIPGVLLDLYFVPLFSSFHKRFPGIDISVVEEGSKLVTAAVGAGRADLGLVMLPIESPSRFETKLLVSDVCQLVVRKDHPFAWMPNVHISDLKGDHPHLQRDGHAPRHLYSDVRGGGLLPPCGLQESDARLQLQDGGHGRVHCRTAPAPHSP